MTEDINTTGIREAPQKGMPEQPYHMTSILHRLFPDVEWRIRKELIDCEGNKECNERKGKLKPDFLSTDLKLIIEIDGDRIGKDGGHFTSIDKAQEDVCRYKRFHDFGYKVIGIPPYIQLDEVMIEYYFGINYSEKLYPASSEHGFAHPQISLPASFCKLGVDRFIRDMETVPTSVRDKIIQTLRDRVAGFQEEGFSREDAMAKVLLPSMWHYIK